MNTSTSSSPDRAGQGANPTPKKTDRFSRDQFEWLRQVAFDAELPPASSRVAAALTKYFSRKQDGWAWMAQRTIADDLNISVRTVHGALSALVERGHLIAKRRGREETNLYRLTLKNEASDRQDLADHDRQEFADHMGGVTGKILQSDRQNRVKVTSKILRTNPLNEPLEEPIEEERLSRPPLGDEKKGRRKEGNQDNTGDHFESWWRQYPKRVDKTDAFKAYAGVIKKKLATHEQLLAGAMRYAAERSGQDPKFTKNPASWLNKGSWENEPAAPISITIDPDGSPIHNRPPDRQPRTVSWFDAGMAGMRRRP